MHQPTEGIGFDCDEDDTPGSYGDIAQVCGTCGTPGEYGVRWPCATVRVIDEELRRLAGEAQQDEALPSSTAPLAAGLPLVKGRCPACGTAGLFLGHGGYVTCSLIDCPEPDAASTVLERTREARQDPAPGGEATQDVPAEPKTSCDCPPTQAGLELCAACPGAVAGPGQPDMDGEAVASDD
jgi:hypothetical protein